jgi:hypothetical protein
VSKTHSINTRLIIELRRTLNHRGLDGGPATIVWHPAHHYRITISRATGGDPDRTYQATGAKKFGPSRPYGPRKKTPTNNEGSDVADVSRHHTVEMGESKNGDFPGENGCSKPCYAIVLRQGPHRLFPSGEAEQSLSFGSRQIH